MIKVGDWVKVKGSDIVGKVTTTGCTRVSGKVFDSFAYIGTSKIRWNWSQLESIPIRFKPFEIKNGRIYGKRHLRLTGKTYTFDASMSDGTIQADVRRIEGRLSWGVNYCYPPTMEEAFVWLTYQYEYIIAKAKARGIL